jgi:hypothetical protein
MKSVRKDVDVLVVGGGSAGVAAGVTAARRGASVALIEKYGFLGGMATAAQVGTICGAFYRSARGPRYIESAFVQEFCGGIERRSATRPQTFAEHLWFLPYSHFYFRRLCDDMCRAAGVQVHLHATVCGVVREERRIGIVQVIAGSELFEFHCREIVDASGQAVVSILAGDEIMPVTGDRYQAGALVFSLSGLVDPDPAVFGLGILKEMSLAVSAGQLPMECARLSVLPGSVAGDTATFKLTIPEISRAGSESLTEAEVRSRELLEAILSHLRSRVKGFAGARVTDLASQVGIRTAPRAFGRAVLTEDDVLGAVKCPDTAASGVWPIEEWGDWKGARLTYFRIEDHYDIPLEAIVSRDTDNLLLVGKNLSATERAVASARVIGTCLALGESAGRVAAERTKC